ncbi:SLOG family protein [Streptomyces tremellae]|uniref:YspA cpYpsA-related SLOG domain-containing protein n=1 Tax=Streptomyces tremellae TaxID=1124239 RepID=A0ABP7EEA6_9ACTN
MTDAPYRVLVTGSRDWAAPKTVGGVLTALLAATAALGGRLILVHGACPTGADEHARAWAEHHRHHGAPIDIEPHPADWRGPRHGGRPDPHALMVELGADACLAFIGPCRSRRCPQFGAHGATSCADMAETVGTPTRRWTT